MPQAHRADRGGVTHQTDHVVVVVVDDDVVVSADVRLGGKHCLS